MAAATCRRENSRQKNRPPGFSTRRASASTAGLSVQLRSPKAMDTRSTARSGSGRRSASATRKDSWPMTRVLQRPVARHCQHGGVDVGQQHRPAATFQPAEADVAGAAGQVQQPVLRARVQRGEEDVLPGTVDAQRHQVVHQVVARRHAVEHRAHHAGFLVPRDLAEAEIGGGGRAGSWRSPCRVSGAGWPRNSPSPCGKRAGTRGDRGRPG